jgi:hypothetical protein
MSDETPDLMGALRRSVERARTPAGLRNVNRCTPCLEGEHHRCTGSAGNVGCGCIHAAPVPVPLPPEPPMWDPSRPVFDADGFVVGHEAAEPPVQGFTTRAEYEAALEEALDRYEEFDPTTFTIKLARDPDAKRYRLVPAEAADWEACPKGHASQGQHILHCEPPAEADWALPSQALDLAEVAVDTERRVELVLVNHQRRDIKGCSCGRWGSDHGHLGQSHAGHLLAELRAAGLDVVAR